MTDDSGVYEERDGFPEGIQRWGMLDTNCL